MDGVGAEEHAEPGGGGELRVGVEGHASRHPGGPELKTIEDIIIKNIMETERKMGGGMAWKKSCLLAM